MNLKLAGLASALPLALGLGATIATAPAPPSAGGPEAVAAVVARQSVLHSGPASNSPSAGTVAKGTVVSVLGPRRSSYVKIETPDDEVGWIAERNLHPVDAATPSPTLSANPTHAGPPDIYPDPTRTPGATNPDITQANIGTNICNPNWSTKTIRPPVSYTNPLKTRQIGEYGYADKT